MDVGKEGQQMQPLSAPSTTKIGLDWYESSFECWFVHDGKGNQSSVLTWAKRKSEVSVFEYVSKINTLQIAKVVRPLPKPLDLKSLTISPPPRQVLPD